MRAARPAADVLLTARQHERAGCMPEAIEQYELAIAQAEVDGAHAVVAEALRRLGVVRHQRDECEVARELCRKSYDVARSNGHELLAAEALNSLGAMHMREGSLVEAKETFQRALAFAGVSRELVARAEQNLGIVANIRGELHEARQHYARSLEAYESVRNEHGCALAYHNLGMVSADQQLYDEADEHFARSLEIAERAGDIRLKGLCLLNHADVHVARQRFEDARRNAEAALVIFDQLGSKEQKGSAYRVIGTVYRETGRPALAESRLRAAIELAGASGSVLVEAESTRELGIVYQVLGRNQEALTLLNTAHRLFSKLDARIDLTNVGRRMIDLEATFLAVVREWGQSIESSDSYTYGHCERVADNAVAVARALGLDDATQTTIRLGAYLHDLGKVKVPHEILNKPGPLTQEEFEVVKLHPVWGVELLAEVEFPWDIKPIIRWHHEKADGTGYPDRLRGDEIPVSAQIVGIVDVYDALTTTRAYRPAMSPSQALDVINKSRASWSPEVFYAFVRAFAEQRAAEAAAQHQAAEPATEQPATRNAA
ncbi:MAG TPA: HD domain-containing phosphohydrolase [Gemmatimonadaceae bacterium]|nr:HD domain-containing phosphohydrolase [Gemmatimonadaceae bacterium]